MAAKSSESKTHLCDVVFPFPQSAGRRRIKGCLLSARRWSAAYSNKKKTSFLRASLRNGGIQGHSAISSHIRCKDRVESYSVRPPAKIQLPSHEADSWMLSVPIQRQTSTSSRPQKLQVHHAGFRDIKARRLVNQTLIQRKVTEYN